MALMEATASRRVVIAAPTGGAADVLPAALLACSPRIRSRRGSNYSCFVYCRRNWDDYR